MSGYLLPPPAVEIGSGGRHSIGVAMAGGSGAKDDADPYQFFPTPPEGTEAFARAEGARIRAIIEDYSPIGGAGDAVWDCACGDGAILKVLARHRLPVIGSDIVDRGYGEGRRDFLSASGLSRIIVTNPPYSGGMAEAFIRRAIALDVVYAAFLLKSTFFHAGERRRLFVDCPPARVLPLAFRLDFKGLGAPTMECAWFIFLPRARKRGWDEPTIYGTPLPRPGDTTSKAFDFGRGVS